MARRLVVEGRVSVGIEEMEAPGDGRKVDLSAILGAILRFAQALLRMLWLIFVLAVVLVLVVSSLASGGVTHPLSGSFGAFLSPGAVAVDQGSGDVLVLDRGANQVLRLDAAGNPANFSALGSNMLDGAGNGDCAGTPADCDQTPQGAFAFDASPGAAQVAVDNSGGITDGEIYVTDSFHAVVDVFASDGRYLGQLSSSSHTGGFAETCGVAVDKTGAVYVAEMSGWVHRYSPFSSPVSDGDLSSEFFAGACSLAVDSAGNIYANQLFWVVNKYSPAGDFQYTVDPNPSYGVAVDPATDGVYVAEGGQVAQYDASSPFGAALLGTFGAGQVGSPAGVAVNGATNQVYVSDANANDVAVFGAAVPTPEATTGAASSVADTTAMLSGTVNPNGTATTWQFEYGLDTSYGQTSPASSGDAGNGSSDVPVSTDLSSLQAGTTYHYRLVAVGANGTTYGADQAFTTQGPPVVEVGSESASPVGKTTATLQAQVNPFGLDTTYHFEYNAVDTSTASDNTSTPDTVISAAQGDQPASADLTGLQPNTTYHYRIVATNALGTVDGEDQTFTTVAVLSIDREYVTGISPSAATLNADINPLGDPTTYHFEYGTTTSYGTNVPAADGDVGSGNGDVTVSQNLSGLPADTLYHYRVVAANSVGTIQGSDHTFRTRALEGAAGDTCPNAGIRATEQASFLPDCRAWEMVSPPEKNGGDIAAAPSRTRAALNGNAVEFASTSGFGDLQGTNALATEYVAERGSTGWGTRGITPQQEPPPIPNWSSRYVGDFSDDLSVGIFFALSPVTSEDPNVASERNLYLRRTLLTPGAGSYQLLSSCPGCSSPLAPLPFTLAVFDPALAGASSNFRHVIFESPLNLTTEATGTGPKLYESVDGHVRLAGILPDDACGTPPCAASESVAGLGALNSTATDAGQFTPHVISADGSRIIFTAGPFADPPSLGAQISGRAGDIFMRVNGAMTVKLNVSERTDCADHNPCTHDPEPDPNGPQPAIYGGASRDGTKVFFMTSEALTDDVTGGTVPNLYMYDINTPYGHHLTLLTQDSEPSDDFANLSKASYVVGTSDDGSYVYFWGSNVLTSGQTNPQGSAVRLLYVWHDGTVRLIARNGGASTITNWGEAGPVNGSVPNEVRVTPDGRNIVFATRNTETASAAGFNNHSEHCLDRSCKEVYLYSYSADRLTCVSCDPGGAEPEGDAEIMGNSDDTTAFALTHRLNRVVTDNGQRVFFDTTDSLVARDTDGKRDVYEYDSMTRRVSLLSSGRSSSDALFVEATPDGNDVFFTTRARLTGVDTDANTDLYDARVTGGIAPQNPPPHVSCEGEECHPPVSIAPAEPVAGTLAFRGPSGGTVGGVRLRIVRVARRGAAFAVLVRVPSAGRITGRGAGVRPLTRSVSKAGTYRLRFRLASHARRMLRHHHRLRLRLRIGYRPAGGALSTATISISVKA